MSQVPRGLRACLVCSFVQAANKWSKTGCPNCEDFLELRNSSDAIGDCTSEVFEGLVTVNDTSTGWVSRWLRIQGYVPGVYATKVNGLLPEDYVAAAENAGIRYIPRDGSANDDDQ
ncbi:transcription initiation Spt4 [Sphaerulina musiva SO2202]|uniref:Transcription elongation factor SPT4 n=1 Tax=Sphaerulina musiva (strain SO2202) TaxID=692275 RepID=M3DBK1_SPHMS|nr:transcription initiation Spt4 [Sphaerulina musiva SO2202]EMF15425.1 transcription initiation Spt4 [Sphaerulina musiva SO2202]